MSARAIWQGNLVLPKHQVAVKLYSAVVDRQVHFHLLHRRDRTRVQQRMVDGATGKPVDLDDARKAYEAEPGVYVEVTKPEIERSVPESSREVKISRFVPTSAIESQFFDRPYYLGPAGKSEKDYFALAKAIENKHCAGIAHWVMRKHSYTGALIARDGYLVLITLRHADEVIPASLFDPPQGRPFAPKEKSMAKQLIEALSGRFEPEAYRDEYEQRVVELIEAKRAGKSLKPKRWRRPKQAGSLVDSLQASLKKVSASRSH